MSPETIRDLEERNAVYAFLEEKEPYMPWDADEVRRWNNGRSASVIPNLGGYRPDGWRLVDTAFYDKGFGGPAMDLNEVIEWAAAIVEKDPTAGFAIVQEGEFQLYIGYFTQNESIEEVEDAFLPSGFRVDEDSYFYCPNEDCGAILLADDTYCESCGWDKDEEDEAAKLAAAPFHEGDVIRVQVGVFNGVYENPFEIVNGVVTAVHVDDESIDVDREDNPDTHWVFGLGWDHPAIEKPYNPAEDPNQLPLL